MRLARTDRERMPHTEPSDQHEPRPLSLDQVRKTQVQIKTVDSDKCGQENPEKVAVQQFLTVHFLPKQAYEYELTWSVLVEAKNVFDPSL